MWGGAGYTAVHVCGVGLVTQLYMCVGRVWLHSNMCGEGLVTQQAHVRRGWLHSYTCVWGGAGYTAIHVCGEGLVTQLYMCGVGGAGYTAIHVCGVGVVTQLYMCVGRGWLHGNAH